MQHKFNFIKSDVLADALVSALETAGDGEMRELAAALLDFKTTRVGSYRSLMQIPFAAKMLNAIEEAADYSKAG